MRLIELLTEVGRFLVSVRSAGRAAVKIYEIIDEIAGAEDGMVLGPAPDL